MRILIILLFMLSTFVHAYESKVEDVTFDENPVKFIEGIAMDYHFGRLDDGLKRVEEVQDKILPKFEKSPDEKAADIEGFNDVTYRQILGVIVTYEAMLLYKKVMNSFANDDANSDEEVDIDEQRELTIEMMKQARDTFVEATQIDSNSAESYYQLGKFLAETSGDTKVNQEAIDAFEKAAELAKEQGNDSGYEQAMKALAEIN